MYFFAPSPPETFAAVRPASAADVTEVDGDGGKAGLDRLDATRGTTRAHPLIGLEKGAATEQQGEAERDAR